MQKISFNMPGGDSDLYTGGETEHALDASHSMKQRLLVMNGQCSMQQEDQGQ